MAAHFSSGHCGTRKRVVIGFLGQPIYAIASRYIVLSTKYSIYTGGDGIYKVNSISRTRRLAMTLGKVVKDQESTSIWMIWGEISGHSLPPLKYRLRVSLGPLRYSRVGKLCSTRCGSCYDGELLCLVTLSGFESRANVKSGHGSRPCRGLIEV
jgi:hypothetical protein